MAGVLTSVLGQVKYPRSALKRRVEGQVELLVEVNADGSLREVEMASSSGSALCEPFL